MLSMGQLADLFFLNWNPYFFLAMCFGLMLGLVLSLSRSSFSSVGSALRWALRLMRFFAWTMAIIGVISAVGLVLFFYILHGDWNSKHLVFFNQIQNAFLTHWYAPILAIVGGIFGGRKLRTVYPSSATGLAN